MMAHIQTGAPALGTEHQQRPQQQQQQRLSGVQQPDTASCKGVAEQCGTGRGGKTILDGRYRLPPRLRKTAGSVWFRGYHARKVQDAPPLFAYEVDITFKVSTSHSGAPSCYP